MKIETLDEYLKRGGKIEKVTRPETHYVDKFEISKPNINKNKEAYFKYVKRGKELKNESTGNN